MRPLLAAALALLVTFASGCIVWRSHLEEGVANFPESLEDARRAPVRLNVEVLVRTPNAQDPKAKKPWTADPEMSERLVALINQANICSEAATNLAFAEGTLRVRVEEEPLGTPGLVLLTALTVGIIPYYGGRRATAQAELETSSGAPKGEWTAVAEARVLGHLLFIAGWNLDALNNLRDDALRGVVVKLAEHQHRLTEVAAPRAGTARAVTAR